MKVWQIRIKLYMLKDIPFRYTMGEVARYIDSALSRQEELLLFHNANEYKHYCFDYPFPLETDKIYKKGNIYQLTIRTIEEKLAGFFSEVLVHSHTDGVKGLTAEIRILPKGIIGKLYSLTPVVAKTDRGYWRPHMKAEEFEERLKVNLIKKWNAFYGTKIKEDFTLYNRIEFMNEKPIPVTYKDIALLGDKITIYPDENPMAQDLAYMALGTGVLENNSRGFGFMNYRLT